MTEEDSKTWEKIGGRLGGTRERLGRLELETQEYVTPRNPWIQGGEKGESPEKVLSRGLDRRFLSSRSSLGAASRLASHFVGPQGAQPGGLGGPGDQKAGEAP